MRTESRFKFAQEQKDVSQSLLVIGCGHNNSRFGGNCTSNHIGATTIDIDPNMFPDFVMDMNNPDLAINLGVKYKKILFEGYGPSFWKETVVQFLLNNLAEDGEVYLTGNSHASKIIVEEASDISENIGGSVYKFVHEYTKIFDRKSLQNRIENINAECNKNYDQIDGISIEESIKHSDLNSFSYLIEQKYEQIIRDDGYEIAKMGNIEFLKYAIENTTLMAVYCSPRDATENYMDFLYNIFSSRNNEEFKRKALEIPKLKRLCVEYKFFQLESWFPEYFEQELFYDVQGHDSKNEDLAFDYWSDYFEQDSKSD
jgi:hypothetical protein